MTPDRDRDAAGRPRSARPRDRLGRPQPRPAGEPSSATEHDPPPLPPAAAVAAGQQLLADGRAFEAHEVFEACWKATVGSDRELWRGLAQLAVGVTHRDRGNQPGAAALLARAAATLAPFAGTTPYDVAVDDLRTWAVTVAADPGATAPVPALRSTSG